MKRIIALILVFIIGLTAFGCSNADKAISSEMYSQEDTQSVEVSYAEATEDFSSANNQMNVAVSSSEEARVADLLLYLAAYQTTPDETPIKYSPTKENMLGFVWALVFDGKYDAVKSVSADKPDVYSRTDINEKILSTVFDSTLSVDYNTMSEIRGWKVLDAYNYSFVEQQTSNGKSMMLGDICVESIEKNEDDNLYVKATVANGFWQSSKSPFLKISAEIKTETSSPFGFRILDATICSTSGAAIAISSVEASSSLTLGDQVFKPENLFDGAINTVWAEAASGSGTKEYIKAYPSYVNDYTTISAIGIVNGNLSDYYSLPDETETETENSFISHTFSNNGRARRIHLTLSDGYSRSYEIPDNNLPTLRPFIILLDYPARVEWVKISIEAASGTPKETGLDVYLSEVYLYR